MLIKKKACNTFNVNDASFLCGILMFCGLEVVGCVPYPISHKYHLVGAFTYFIGFIVYGFLQMHLSSACLEKQSCLRSFAVLFSLVALVVGVIFFPPFGFFGRKTEWISKTCEWSLGVCFSLFFATLYHELEA